ncbi:MAG: DEAD/DEAH box helicase [Myxococcota bacterium]
MELRPYQAEAIEKAREKLRTERSTLVVLPTGAGKTVVFSEIARLAIEKGGRVLVLAHRTELLDQATAKLEAVAPDLKVDREQAGNRAGSAPVVVASVQTLGRPKRLARWDADAFRLIIVDEAHHAAANSYQRILAHFASAKVLGFTATPDRSDGIGLRATFESIAYSRSMLDLVRLGHLAPISGRVVTVEGFDVEGVKVVAGDFQEKGLIEALDEPGVLDSVAKAILAHAGDRSTLVFVPGVAIAYDLATLLDEDPNAGGAVAIDGTTAADERAIRFAQFQRGSKRFLVNVGIATEGTDLPRCSCVAVVRPTMSRSLFVQMVGRGCRLFPGKKDCLVLNFAPKNCRHRLIVPVDAMLGDDVDELTRQAIRELAELEPDAPVESLIERAEDIAADRRRKVHSIEARLKAWDPFGILDVSEPAHGRAVPDDERDRAADFAIDSGVPPDLISKMTAVQIVAVARSIRQRKRAGLCTVKMARQLARRGLNPNASMKAGMRAMAALGRVKFRFTPPSLHEDPELRLPEGDAA